MFIEVNPPSYEYHVKLFQANVHYGENRWLILLVKYVEKHLWSSTCICSYNITLHQVIFDTFSKLKQTSGFYIRGRRTGNGLNIKIFSNISFSGGLCHIETVQLISDANQSTGFFMTRTFTGSYFWK